MNKDQAKLLMVNRIEARSSNKPHHVYPLNEEKLHTLEVSQTTLNENAVSAYSQTGALCFCEPDVEDYTSEGGGQLIVHRQVCWQ